MKIKETLNPFDGIFSRMPDTIWGDELDTSKVDIELYARVGELTASPLYRIFIDGYGELDNRALAAQMYHKYSHPWLRKWAALSAEYNILLTSSLDEVRTTTRDSFGNEIRDLRETGEEVAKSHVEGADINTRTGSVTTGGSNNRIVNLADKETRNLVGTNKDGGTVTTEGSNNSEVTETRNLKTTGSDTGSIATTGSSANTDTEYRDITSTGTDLGTDHTSSSQGKIEVIEGKGSGETITHGLAKTESWPGYNETVTDTNTKVGTEELKRNYDGNQLRKVSTTGQAKTITNESTYGIGSGSEPTPTSSTSTVDYRSDGTNPSGITETTSGDIEIGYTDARKFKDGWKDENKKTTQRQGSARVEDSGQTKTVGTGEDTTTTEQLHPDWKEFAYGKSTTNGETGTVSSTKSGRETNHETRNLATRGTDEGKVTTGTEGGDKNKETRALTGSTTDSGTVTTAHTGTDRNEESSTQSYNNLRDTSNSTTDGRSTKTNSGAQTGTVKTDGKEQFSEKFHSEGSSPLRTYAALIQEELELRNTNFIDIIIRDVQSEIALKIWERKSYFEV